MSMNEDIKVSRRVCPVIFLLDSSGSMDGKPMGAVNEAITGVLPELNSQNEENADTEIMIAIMTFSNGAEWVTGENLVSTDYKFNELSAVGMTDMGAAFRKLNDKLSSKTGFLTRASGSVAPVLFLLSDGVPTDDYKSGLNKLKENPWYKVAARVAVGYGESCDDNVLLEFTDNIETVLHTNDPKMLTKMIRFVTITSSMVASKTNAVDADDTNPDDNTAKVGKELEAQGAGELAAGDPDDGFDN